MSFPTTLDAFQHVTNGPAPQDPPPDSSWAAASVVDGWLDALNTLEKQSVGPALYNVKGYGAKGDGATDDTTAIAAALSAANLAGGGTVYFPAGTYLTGQQMLSSFVHLRGAGIEATVLKLKAAANQTLLLSQNFATLTGTNSTGGINQWSIQDVTLDGNAAGQTAGVSDVLQVYGYGYILHNVRIRNARTDGFYSEWANSAASPGQDSMEAQITNLKIHDCGARGINWNGPHDSVVVNLIAYACPLPLLIAATPNGTACQWTNVHCWGVSAGGTVGLSIGSPSQQFHNLQVEGGITGQVLVLAGGIDIIGGKLFTGAGDQAVFGLQLGDATHPVSQCRILTTISNCISGAVDFANDAGASLLDVVTVQGSGPQAIGVLNASSVVKLTSATQGNAATQSGAPLGNVLRNAAGIDVFNVNLGNNQVQVVDGAFFVTYSDAYTTLTAALDGSTGAWRGGSYAAKASASSAPVTGGTIATPIATGTLLVAPAANVTGMVLAAGTNDGQECTLCNNSAFTLTFAAAASSHVAGGVAEVVPANAARAYRWVAALNLWFGY